MRTGERLAALLDALEQDGDPRTVATVRELVALLLDAHGAGLARVLAALEQRDGPAALAPLLEDPLVRDLLLLHDLHPTPVAERVAAAVARVAQDLGPLGSDLELVAMDDHAVHVRLGAAAAPHAARAEAALRAALDVAAPDAPPLAVADAVAPRRTLPVVP